MDLTKFRELSDEIDKLVPQSELLRKVQRRSWARDYHEIYDRLEEDNLWKNSEFYHEFMVFWLWFITQDTSEMASMLLELNPTLWVSQSEMEEALAEIVKNGKEAGMLIEGGRVKCEVLGCKPEMASLSLCLDMMTLSGCVTRREDPNPDNDDIFSYTAKAKELQQRAQVAAGLPKGSANGVQNPLASARPKISDIRCSTRERKRFKKKLKP